LKNRNSSLRQIARGQNPAHCKETIMSPEERQLLAALFDRVKSAANTPRDADAESFISQSVKEVPYAPYFLSQAVIIQEQGLKAAADRIEQLETQLRELEEHRGAAPQQSQSGGFLGGLGSLFGGGQSDRPHASVPQAGTRDQQGRLYDDYARNAPQPQQQQQPVGPWTQQPAMPSAGGSFLRGALGTAAGVAGGVMLADSLRSLFSPHLGGIGGGSLFGGGMAGQPIEETVVNNTYYGNDGRDDQNQDDGSQIDDGQNNDASDDDAADASDDSFNV
jgi:hypothetical protein